MSRIIAVASGKGGLGKTWLAITLSQALARFGQRVLLFDGDLGLANVDIQLGLDPQRDLGGVLSGRYALAGAVQRLTGEGFDLIAGRSGSGLLAGIGTERIAELLAGVRALASAYDQVLLDLSAGIDGVVRRLLVAADVRLVVTSDEPTALTDAYALIKVSQRDRAPGEVRIAVNLAQSHAAGRRTYEGLSRVCERFLGLEPALAGVVRRDPRVPDAIRHQTAFLARHPMSPAACDVEAMARRLLATR